MRILPVLGVVLIIGGAAILWKHPTYRTREDVVTIGDLKAMVLLLAASRRNP